MGEKYGSFYSGGFSSFEPTYGSNSNFTGFKMDAATLSSNTNPTVANQIKEAVARIKEGVHNVEIGTIDPQMFESIPKQHFEELRALMKLSGVDASLHAPINGMDPAGADNNGFSEEQRASTERRLFEALRAAKTISPDKGINVVIHSAVNGQVGQGYGATYKPGDESQGEERFKITQLGIVDKGTGRFLGQLKEEQTYKFDNPNDFEKKGTIISPKKRLEEHNSQQWKQSLFDIGQTMQQMDIEIRRGGDQGILGSILERTKKGVITDKSQLSKEELEVLQNAERSGIFLDMAKNKFDSAFAKAYEYGKEGQKTELTQLANNFKKRVGEFEKDNVIYREIYREELDKAVLELDRITKDNAPVTMVSAEEYAKEEASKTFGNLAWRSFNDLGKGDASKAPVLAIENLYTGNTSSTANDLKGIVEKSRSNFIETAIKKGISKEDAKSAADKIIGVTWDVGHLNMFKREGFTDTDLVEQTKKIAKYVKHVHLTDNFGYADTHLAPGMGNVPFKEVLKELEKTGKLGEMKKVIEAGGLIANQLTNSQLKPTLGAFGVQMTSGGGYWNQATGLAAGGGYFGGQAYLPEKHFSMYGTGFSSLPTELGGQIPGSTSRATGTPMA